MPKLDWVPLVDQALGAVDRALDKVRKTPRKRLDRVPVPPPIKDPFAQPAAEAAPAAAAAPAETPLGDPELAAQVYGRRTCMWSGRAQRLLQDLGATVRFYDLEDPDHRHLENRLIRETKQVETPWVWVRGELVGGYHALDELARLGRLEVMILPPDQRPSETKRRVRIELPTRPEERRSPGTEAAARADDHDHDHDH